MLNTEGCRLVLKKGAITAIVHEAMRRRTGARGLRSVLENTFNNLMYELPSMQNVIEAIIDEEVVTTRGEKRPEFIYKKNIPAQIKQKIQKDN